MVLLRHRARERDAGEDRKSTRLNSSHLGISYAVFCLKKKKDLWRNRNLQGCCGALSQQTQRGTWRQLCFSELLMTSRMTCLEQAVRSRNRSVHRRQAS